MHEKVNIRISVCLDRSQFELRQNRTGLPGARRIMHFVCADDVRRIIVSLFSFTDFRSAVTKRLRKGKSLTATEDALLLRKGNTHLAGISLHFLADDSSHPIFRVLRSHRSGQLRSFYSYPLELSRSSSYSLREPAAKRYITSWLPSFAHSLLALLNSLSSSCRSQQFAFPLHVVSVWPH